MHKPCADKTGKRVKSFVSQNAIQESSGVAERNPTLSCDDRRVPQESRSCGIRKSCRLGTASDRIDASRNWCVTTSRNFHRRCQLQIGSVFGPTGQPGDPAWQPRPTRVSSVAVRSATTRPHAAVVSTGPSGSTPESRAVPRWMAPGRLAHHHRRRLPQTGRRPDR